MRRTAVRGLLGAGALVLSAAVLLLAQGVYAARRDYLGAAEAVGQDLRVGEGLRPPLQLVVLGDSTAAGVGATRAAATVGGRLAEAVSVQRTRPVRLLGLGVSGARSRDVAGQLDRLPAGIRPDVVVVLVGANDAIHRTGLADVRAGVQAAVEAAADRGARVVVGTCPDLGAGRALPRPLRDLAAWRGRAVADASAGAAESAGARAVDLAALTGPAFRADRATLSSDAWHPSDRGYGLWADALAPAVLAAIP